MRNQILILWGLKGYITSIGTFVEDATSAVSRSWLVFLLVIHTLRSNSNLKMLAFQDQECHIAGKGWEGGGGSSVSTAPSLLTVNYTTVLVHVHVSSVFSCAACTCLHVRSHFGFR